MRGLSLRVKVFFLFAGAALLIVVPALLLIADAVKRQAYQRATADVENAGAQLLRYWALRAEGLQDKVQVKAADSVATAAWLAGRERALERRLRNDADKEVVVVVDTTFRTLLGPELQREVLETAAAGGRPLVVLPDSGLPLLLAVREASRDTVRLGWVGVGERLSASGLKKQLAESNAELALLVGESVVGLTFDPDSAPRAEVEALSRAVVGQPQGATERYPVGGQTYLSRIYRVPGAGLPVRVAVFRPVAEELRIAEGITKSLFGIGFLALLTAVALAALVARIVARPTQALAEAAKRLARGDYDAPLPRDSGDEIGQLSRTFGEMRRTLAERDARLRSAQAEMIHREKLAAMGRLVAQLSHEINNPIYNIQNCLEALERRGDPGDPNREFLELAQEELARMATLTRQLLDQSRPLSDAAQPVSLNTLVHRVLTLAGPELQARGIRAETDLAADLPRVVVHPEGVQQVLANLVNNALDAMPGGGRLRLSTRADADAVEVVVEDTGTGIAEADLPHIFEAFYTTKPGVAGIGLGLFVSEGIIRGHRGRLSVESRPGDGSRFTVRLPRETLDEAAAPGEPRPDEEAAAAAA
ncbi:MAG TPA: ATP-binding protein [Longimicrobium sp.]|jgi:signal transduction histidine kinase